MSKPAVGVIGLGNIGRGVATNLGKPEHDVHVWDVAEPARAYFTDKPAFAITRPADMARTCDVILFVVPSTPQIKACLEGDDGIIAHARDGLILVDLTTSDPLATRELAAALNPRGIHYIDAGASGGKQRADAGDLTLMVGGDAGAVAGARPYLDAIAREVFHLGESGAGHTMKLVHNIICHANFMAAAEAFNVGERAGLKLADMVAVVNQSNGRSYITEQRFPNHILSQTWDGRSHVSNLHKDLTMGVELARRLGGGSEFSEATVRYLDQAMRRGMADEDFTLIYRYFDAIRAMED